MTGGCGDDETEWFHAPVTVQHNLLVWPLTTDIQGGWSVAGCRKE